MNEFRLKSHFQPTGDQPQAIAQLSRGVQKGLPHQVLLGVTGSGKTYTMANLVEKTQKPVLIISHNKTLAAQLFQEYRDFFPENAVEYFVSYYDYYQPEAYIPQNDTYITKDASINEFIEKMRLSATTSLLTRQDVIVVASVSCIYNLGSPVEYASRIIELAEGMSLRRQDLIKRLTRQHYDRNDYDFRRSTFRVKGDIVDIWPAYQDLALRLEIMNGKLFALRKFDPLTGETEEILKQTILYPAKHYLTAADKRKKAVAQIKRDLQKRVNQLKEDDKNLEAYRLEQRTNYDLELISEIGYCSGIENYSRYFDGREPGEPPHTLLDFFAQKESGFLTIIDESHMTVPQIRGMYRGDQGRKRTLIDHGFRLPSALDNRPLTLEEFLERVPQIIYTSATPGEWEIGKANDKDGSPKKNGHYQTSGIVEQLIRPTGLLDPEIEVHSTKNQIQNLIDEVIVRTQKKERVLITTLTKRMAEDLSEYLKEQNIRAHYLHADVDTLDRSDILEDLRRGKYDAVVGINLLREGLDLPEVSLVAILDADKEGFLRSTTSLIQVMGRAARHVNGKVIMYADTITKSMQEAIDEVNRRREIQENYNHEHHITPRSIDKPIREKLIDRDTSDRGVGQSKGPDGLVISERDSDLESLERKMLEAAENLEFEKAAYLRDKISDLKETNES